MKSLVVIIVVSFIAACRGAYLDDEEFDSAEKRLAPGQIISKCSKYLYGCCPDGITKMLGPRKQGCPCENESVSFCEKQGKQNCGVTSVSRRCRFMCNPECQKMPGPESCNSKNGCCWNGQPKSGNPRDDGCPPCMDELYMINVCNQFQDISQGCNSGSSGIRHFLQMHCPDKCQRCL